MTPDWIECLIATNLRELHHPVKDQKLDELGNMIGDDIPPDSILTEFSIAKVGHQFLVNKRINTYTAHRLRVKARGNEPQSEPPDIKGLVRSLAAYYHAQYDLLFECWEHLKPAAVRDGLLSQTDRPGDALKIILDDSFYQAFANLAKDNRSLGKQARSIHDRATRDIAANKNNLADADLNSREISIMSHDWDIEFETLHPLLQMLLNIATNQSKKPGVIATAHKHYSQTLIDYQREQITYHRRLFVCKDLL